MSVPFQSRDLVHNAAENLATGVQTGFAENLFSAFDQFRSENLSVSEVREYQEHWHEQYELAKQHGFETPERIATTPDDDYLKAHRKRPGLTPQQHTIEKRDATFRQLQRQFPEAGFKLSGDLYQDMIERLGDQRERHLQVRNRAGTAGKFGAMLGDMAGATTDPLVYLTMPLGASGSAGILRTVLTEAAVGAASEAAIQPQVFDFKKELASPYTAGEAAANVALAGLGAGAFAGIVKSVPYAYGPLLRRYRSARENGELPEPTERERVAEEFLERYTEESDSNPFPPDLPDSVPVHAENLQRAVKHAADGEVVPPSAVRLPEQVSRETRRERRTNLERRKTVAEMTPDERARELLTDDLTPLANRRAFREHMEENPDDFVLFGDLDDFKQLNTKLGHAEVDEKVFPLIGEIKQQVADDLGIKKVARRTGDEFLAAHATRKQLKKFGAEVQKRLQNAIVEVELPDGTITTHRGIGYSFGVGLNERLAEIGANRQKTARRAAGLRTGARDADAVSEPPARGGEDQTGVPAGRPINLEAAEAQAARLQKDPSLLDDVQDAETASILEENPDLEIMTGETVDTATGERVPVMVRARDLLREAAEEKEAAEAFIACATGVATE